MLTLIGNEWLKLRTTRGLWILLAVQLTLITVGAAGPLSNMPLDQAATAIGAVAHVGLTSLVALILGISAVAGEYRHKTITDTYLGTPRRGRVVAAKLTATTLVGAGLGVAGAAVSLAVTWVWLTAAGHTMPWSEPELWRTAAGGVVWNAAFAAIGVGVGALVRNLAVAVAASLAWLALVEGIVGQVAGRDVTRYLPFSAGTAVGRLPASIADGLPQSGAAALLAGYAVLFAAAAVVFSTRRDVA
ncbi:ABC transporter permease [Catellatospora sichuanensis]|uniref:ABC transporter permease n=1 Tax=Catellatospora sichuanensis TaxID=1969805 RepID=UPI0011832237|nr:hypothetical protein [Catellatospora sichuanensis]